MMRVMMINIEDDDEMFEELILIKDRTRRAKRRKATAHKHQRTDIIMDVYGVKPEYRKHGKKVLQDIHEERMYNHGCRDLSRLILKEAQQEAEYEELKTAFNKAVDKWLNDYEDYLEWLYDYDAWKERDI